MKNVADFSVEQRKALSGALESFRLTEADRAGEGDTETRNDTLQKLESGGELDRDQVYILHVAVANEVEDEATRAGLHRALGNHPVYDIDFEK